MKKTVSIAFLMVSQTCLASQSAVLESFRCAEPTGLKLISTALVFEKDGNTYAIASESRTLSGDSTQYCHQIRAGSQVLPMRLAAADYGSGLALLSTSGTSLHAGPIPQIAAAIDSGATVSFLGSGPEKSARILSLRSDRHAIPAIKDAIELFQTDVSSADVGAAILDPMGGFVGVITHQYLTIEPGGPTLLTEWPLTGAVNQTHVVAVSAADVSSWLTKTLANPSYVSGYSVNAEDRLLGNSRVQAGDLNFTLDCPIRTNPGVPDNSEYPIGGDGFGIGGSFETGKICKIKMAHATSTAPFPILGFQDWAHAVDTDIAQDAARPVEVWYLSSRDPDLDRLNRGAFGSLSEFFRELSRNSGAPVTIVGKDATLGIDPAVRPIRLQGTVVAHAAVNRFTTECATNANIDLFLKEIYFHAVQAESEEMDLLHASDLGRLISPSGDWQDVWGLLTWNCPLGDTLLQELKKLHDMIEARK